MQACHVVGISLHVAPTQQAGPGDLLRFYLEPAKVGLDLFQRSTGRIAPGLVLDANEHFRRSIRSQSVLQYAQLPIAYVGTAVRSDSGFLREKTAHQSCTGGPRSCEGSAKEISASDFDVPSESMNNGGIDAVLEPGNPGRAAANSADVKSLCAAHKLAVLFQ